MTELTGEKWTYEQKRSIRDALKADRTKMQKKDQNHSKIRGIDRG